MNWDNYFLDICNAVAHKSPCLSRKIGAIIVRDNSILSTGYNGPASGIPHCGKGRLFKDQELVDEVIKRGLYEKGNALRPEWLSICPRRVLEYASGEGMQWCTAQHAEENAITNAAKVGVSTNNATLYLNNVIPCQNCFSTIINAGIIEIVCLEKSNYDKYSKFIIENSSVKIRTFNVK